MAEEQKNSETTEQAAVAAEKTEQKATQTETSKEASGKKEVAPVLEGGQGKDAPTLADYKEAVKSFNEKAREVAELKKAQVEQGEYLNQIKQTFNPPAQAIPGQAGSEPMTAKEWEAEANRYKEAGLDLEYKLCKNNAIQAKKLEKIDSHFSQNNQMRALYEKYSKDDSPVNPEQINWEEVGEISAKNNVSIEFAADHWVQNNLKNIVIDPLLEKEREIAGKANQARSLDGDYDLQMPDEEKKQSRAEHAEIGDPRYWKKE